MRGFAIGPLKRDVEVDDAPRTRRDLLASFLNDRSAATAIEYSIIAAGIALVIVAVVNGIGTTLQGTFSTVQTGLK
jgi:pilus assembly protein Flp/PilA